MSDVQSRIDIFFKSDHFVLEAVIKILAPHPKKEIVEKTHRYDKPTPSQWTQYNEDIKSCLDDEVRFDLKLLLVALQQSAEKNLDRTPPEKRKPYLTRQTWEKIQERNRLRCNKAPETEVRKLSKEIAELAKRDNPIDHSKKGLWKAVRGLKINYPLNMFGWKIRITSMSLWPEKGGNNCELSWKNPLDQQYKHGCQWRAFFFSCSKFRRWNHFHAWGTQGCLEGSKIK